ncbi:hypothetical protein N7522_001935 [Penicillium canescens]|nr:hypothetical protein N7522_001935 [Penicillium canescens]
MTAHSSETLSEMLPSALETLMPGLSLFTRTLSLYSHIDVSTCSSYILLFALLSAFSKFAVPRLYENLQQLILYFAASIDVKFESSLHDPLIKWASENDQLKKCRQSIAVTKSNFTPPWKEDDADEESQDEDPAEEQRRFEKNKRLFWQSQRMKGGFQPISYTPGQNQLHVFRYRGHLIGLYRNPRPSLSNTWLMDAETITIFGWGKRILIELLEEVQEAYFKRKGNRVAIYRGLKLQNMLRWALSSSKPPRSLSTLALAPKTKSELLADIESFLSPKTKSCMCFVIAGLLYLDIYTISLNTSKVDEDSLSKLFQELPSRCIILLEDVDNAGIVQPLLHEVSKSDEVEGFSEDWKTIHSGVSLSALLNCLDGVGAQEGRILIMTTNHPDKLDAALTRPGRVDKKYCFGYADKTSIKSIFSLVYNPFVDGLSAGFTSSFPAKKLEDRPARAMANRSIRDLSIEFAELVPDDQFTAAEIQSYLLDFKDDPDMAVKKAAEWVKKR